MGFTLRSLLLSRGNRGVSTRLHPPTVSLTGIPCAETQGRLGKPRFLGFDPLRSPWRPSVCLARQPLDAPLGFSLLGPATKTLARISPGLLSRAFSGGSKPAPAAPQSITRPSFRPLRRRSKLRSGRGQPFEGSCTGSIPFIRANATRAMCSPCEAYRIAAAGTRSLGGNSLYRSCRRICCSNQSVSASTRPPGWLLVQSTRRLRYRRYWFDDPTLPLAIPSAVWFSLSRLRWATVR
jgi:hypothetical protein